MAAFEGMLFVALQLFIRFKDRIVAKGWIHDPFAVGNLQASVHWSGFEFLLGVFLLAGVLISIVAFRKNIQQMTIGIFMTTLIFTTLSVFVITPKVEGYSQNAAIDFYTRHAGQNAYVEVWGFKSYAQYFYFRKKPPETLPHVSMQQKLNGEISKPVYVVTKITGKAIFQKRYSAFHLLYEKNGFAFFKREPDSGIRKSKTDD